MRNLIQGDCLEELKKLEDNSIDAILTDPPYGLSFMGKKWDYDVPSVEIWAECLRVLKPGGYLLSFAGTRTQHRMAVRIEDAGFEIRDMIAWVYGSGFPKSLNIGKAVDKMQGNEREEYIDEEFIKRNPKENNDGVYDSNLKDGVDGAKRSKGTSEWEGWGTALKPALEPITVARKPLEGTVAENCLKWGVGGINIDECRVGTKEDLTINGNRNNVKSHWGNSEGESKVEASPLGRFPANLIHDNSEEVRECFPDSKGTPALRNMDGEIGYHGNNSGLGMKHTGYSDDGSAARFFYCAKASKSERNMGCEGLEEKEKPLMGEFQKNPGRDTPKSSPTARANFHPTVKPIALMEYLVKLVSKEGHLILDPFAGSGSTLIAAKKLKRNYIGIDLDPEYIKIAEARLKAVKPENTLFNA